MPTVHLKGKIMQFEKEIKNPPHFQLIEDDQALLRVCQQATQQSAVALDTEFVRVRSYYPKLGLIQLYDGEQVSLIIPDNIQDFSPFIGLLANDNVTKILHACSEDLEVFSYYFQQLPTPMMDTQIIAHFLGFAYSTGFASLITHYFNLTLNKETARTDWLARPLSLKQLNYAAADVWYLLPLYHRMQQALAQTPWKSAVENDCMLMLEKSKQTKKADKAYLNIANAWKLNRVELTRLQLLAKWRQEEAIQRDLALNFVVKTETIWNMAKYNPKNTTEMLNLGIHPNEIRHHGKKMLRLLHQANQLPMEQYPVLIERLSDDLRYKASLKTLQQRLRELTPKGLAPEVVASKRSLEKLMKWAWRDQQNPTKLPDLLKGWRYKIGKQLLSILC